MQKQAGLFLLVLFSIVVVTTSVSLGDRLVRTYTEYVNLPGTVDSATSQGWNATGACNPRLGIPYNYKGNSPQVESPLTIYFTPAGQVAGVGIEVYGTLPQHLIDVGAWQTVLAGQQYHLSVSFRSIAEICSSTKSANPIGDVLIVNADTIAFNIPTTEPEVQSAKWHKGSCFAGMGHHYFYDVATAPAMSWEAQNLFPVVTMFNNSVINAIFFASPTVQQGLFDAHWWEPIPLLNTLMCDNWCDSSCTFSGTSAWSTFHIYFRDHNVVSCAGGCTLSCCP